MSSIKMTMTLGRVAEGVLQKETKAERKRIRSDFILFTRKYHRPGKRRIHG
jgi:hypothetical protein